MLTEVNPSRLSKILDSASVNAEQADRRAKHFHASEAGQCLRKTSYELLGAPTPQRTGTNRYNPNWDMAARQGDLIHARVQQHFLKSGLVLPWPSFGPAIEIPLAVCCHPSMLCDLKLANYSGRLDLIVRRGSGLCIVDIKTTGGDTAEDMEQKQAQWERQMNMYLGFFRLASHGYVYQIARGDTSCRRLYRVDFDPGAFEQEMSRLHAAAKTVRGGNLPDPEPKCGPCRFCRFRPVCPAYESGKLKAEYK